MSGQTIRIDQLADTVMKGLEYYAKLAADDLKSDVQKAGKKVKEQIESTAPKDTGKYAKSWAVKKTKETSDSIQVVVHSKNRYQLTHLLEFGHAKRGGGRVAARPHIAAAEAAGMEQLTRDIERDLRKGG
ncbi:HK97 gp10 family phage protein [Enterocloster clostridioformis]|uniref:HK97 gp10 family phage protein n=1 Tax=Enterocloster clostridioformis TaxID=1531 RepID=UPI0018AAB2ED|nr:HK97 gp10 family phage protein [Enterocloster clostridioformis]MDB2127472.1 HK97 gp10 family phage protein [Enterocloster clostridioformis]